MPTNNFLQHDGPAMQEQCVTKNHFHVEVEPGKEVHISPELLAKQLGVLDPDHARVKELEMSVTNINHDGPVGVTLSHGDQAMLRTTDRVAFVSNDTHKKYKGDAPMVHAVARAGMPSESMTMTLKPSTEIDPQLGKARNDRWHNTKAGDVGPDNLPHGTQLVTDPQDPTNKAMVVNLESDHPFPKFWKDNVKENRDFCGRAYNKAETIEFQGQEHMVVDPKHVEESAAALKQHLTPLDDMRHGLTIKTHVLNDQAVSPNARTIVKLTASRTPISDEPLVAEGAAIKTACVGATPETQATQLQTLVFPPKPAGGKGPKKK